jgi:hypothetical protein
MNILIKKLKFIQNLRAYLDKNPKLKQWLWFFSLWFFGFAVVSILTYPIKFLFRFL